MPREFSEDTERRRPPEIDETHEQQEVDEISKTAEEIASDASEKLEEQEKIEQLTEESLKELEELDSNAERAEEIARDAVKELEGLEEDLGYKIEEVREELHEEFVNDMKDKLEERSVKETSSESEETTEGSEAEETAASGESHIEGSDGMVYVIETGEVSESKAELEIEESVEPSKEETPEVQQTTEETQEVTEQEVSTKVRNSIVRPKNSEIEETESEQVETPERKKEHTTTEEQSIEETTVDEPKREHAEKKVVKESQEIEESSSTEGQVEIREVTEEKMDIENEREELATEQDEIVEDEHVEISEVEDEPELSFELPEAIEKHIEELVEELVREIETQKEEEEEVDESRIIVDSMTGKEHIDRTLEYRPYFEETEEDTAEQEQKSAKEKIADLFVELSEEEREKFKEKARPKLETVDELDELIERNTSVRVSPDYKEKYEDAKKYIRGKRKGEVPRLIRELWKDEVEQIWTKLVGVVYRKQLSMKLGDKLTASRILQDWTQERLDKLLAQHSDLKKNSRFKKRYRNAVSWMIIMIRMKDGQIKYEPSMEVLNELSKEFLISIPTIRKWLKGKTKPMMIVQLERRIGLRQKPGGFKTPLVIEQTITNEISSSLFSGLIQVRSNLTQRICKLIQNTLKNYADGIWFSEFLPKYQQLLDHISIHGEMIEKSLSTKTHQVVISVVGNRIYLSKKKLKEFSWTDLLDDELFYINPKWKRDVIGKVLGKLRLKNLTQLSEVIREISGYGQNESVPVGGKNADLQSRADYFSGRTLGFILRVLEAEFKDVKKYIVRLGRSTGKKWQIKNPIFPEDLELKILLSRLFAIIASDGHIKRHSYRLIYSEETAERRRRVLDIIAYLGDVWALEIHDSERGDSIEFPSILGRLMHKIGIPVGDKVLQGHGIPKFILNGPLEVQKAYLQELIPEEGSVTYNVYGGLKILWGRTVVLHEERSSKKYAEQKSLKKDLIDLIKDEGDYEEKRQCYRLSAGKLRKLKSHSDRRIARLATELDTIARKDPSRLLLDEKKLCKKLGIKTGHHLCYVRYYVRSGRVSAHWEAHTSSQKDVEKWWKIAPPNDERKRARLDEYFSSKRDDDEAS